MALPKEYHKHGRLKVIRGNHPNDEVTIIMGYYDYLERNKHIIPNNEFKLLYYIDKLVNDDTILLICSGYCDIRHECIEQYTYFSSTLYDEGWRFLHKIILLDIPNGSTIELNSLIGGTNKVDSYRYFYCMFVSLKGYNKNCTIIVNNNALCGEHVFINLPESTKIIKNTKPQELNDISKCAYDAAEKISKSTTPYSTNKLNELKEVLTYTKKPYWYKIHRITIGGDIVGIHGNDRILNKQGKHINDDELHNGTIALVYIGIIFFGLLIFACSIA